EAGGRRGDGLQHTHGDDVIHPVVLLGAGLDNDAEVKLAAGGLGSTGAEEQMRTVTGDHVVPGISGEDAGPGVGGAPVSANVLNGALDQRTSDVTADDGDRRPHSRGAGADAQIRGAVDEGSVEELETGRLRH